MVSHVLKIDPTYPKQVREEEEESDALAQARDSRSSENLTVSTTPNCHFSPRRDNSRSSENPPAVTPRIIKVSWQPPRLGWIKPMASLENEVVKVFSGIIMVFFLLALQATFTYIMLYLQS
ncbi:hypothetical protein Lal_00044349 [Lupinus albus]|nr:hypothetical protein Lal_00044349 [Lupinus albus]